LKKTVGAKSKINSKMLTGNVITQNSLRHQISQDLLLSLWLEELLTLKLVC